MIKIYDDEKHSWIENNLPPPGKPIFILNKGYSWEIGFLSTHFVTPVFFIYGTQNSHNEDVYADPCTYVPYWMPIVYPEILGKNITSSSQEYNHS